MAAAAAFAAADGGGGGCAAGGAVSLSSSSSSSSVSLSASPCQCSGNQALQADAIRRVYLETPGDYHVLLTKQTRAHRSVLDGVSSSS